MIAATGLRWTLTALFCALAFHGLWRAAVSAHANQRWVTRLAHVLHSVMAVAMVAMVWPWGMDLLVVPQVVFFSLVAAWFLVAGLAWPAEAGRAKAAVGALPHALMTGAMAWMVAAMAWGTSMGSSGGGGGHAGHDMPGKGMSQADLAGAMALSGTGYRWSAGILTLGLLSLALWWLTRGFDTGRREPSPETDGATCAVDRDALDLGCHGAMALGMAVMFVLML